VVEAGRHLHHRRRHLLEQHRDGRPRGRPAVRVELPPAARPPRRVEDGGAAAGHLAAAGRRDQLDGVPGDHPHVVGDAERLDVGGGQLAGDRVLVDGQHAGAGAGQRDRVGAGGAAEVGDGVGPAGEQAGRAAGGELRAAGLLEGVRGEQHPVGVGPERRPRLLPLAGDAPRRPGQVRPHLGAQPGQPGDRVGAGVEQRAGPGQGRGALRRREGAQLAHRLVGLRGGVRVHRHSVAHAPVRSAVAHRGTGLSGWHSRR
jgi:hypothetical protein